MIFKPTSSKKVRALRAALLGATIVVPATFTTVEVQAQQTTSEIRGFVTDANGAAIANAQVTVTDTRTGASRRVTSDNDGSFAARSLVVGGPYTVAVQSAEYGSKRVDGVFVSLGSAASLTVALDAVADTQGAVEEIIITASASTLAQVAIGPNTTFGVDSLEAFPSISRDIRDIIRIDPRVSLDRSNEVDRVSCLGGNDRTNTFTVDGVIQSDVFGLNGTPFAARNSLPLPFDAINQTSVEFAPFDVEYGQFTGCNINVVTKSGSNEFHGSAFFVYNNDDLQGKKIEGERFELAPFDDYNWGATFGGPIIKDKLFFFVAYEETSDADSQDIGPIGGNYADEDEEGLPTLGEVEEVQQILESVYGLETGGLPRSLPQDSRRILTRWDWFINEDHRLEFTYQRLRESNIESDFSGNSFGEGFSFYNSFEDEGTKSNTYSARLFSNWTDNFSTEIRFSRADVQDVQGPVGGGEAQSDNPIPRIIVGTGTGTVLFGPGFSRSANQLDSQVDQVKVKGAYSFGDHLFTAGYELNQLDIFNLFVQNATGTLVFTNIEDLRNGVLSTGTRTFFTGDQVNSGQVAGAVARTSFSGDINDAAASFSRSIHSLYLQDEWQATDELLLQFGLRYEFYKGSDTPLENPNFINRYGFTNAQDFDGLDAFLPRLGFTYDLGETFAGYTQVRGGIGLFTGGDPTVWFSNAFSNAGGNQGEGNSSACSPAELVVFDANGNFTGIPQCVFDAAAAQASNNAADTQSTDPNLDLATVIRSNIGISTVTDFQGSAGGFFDDWRIDLDFIHSRFRNPYSFVDLSQVVNPARGLNGFTVDGRPIYAAIDPTRNGCDAQLVGQGGTPPTYTNVSAACFGTSRDDEIQLTNTDGYSAFTISSIFAKRFEHTVLGSKAGSTNVSIGYAFTDSENRRDLQSSTSTSNFDGTALFDRQNPSVGTSGFETRHSFSFALNTRQEWIENYGTSLGLFFSARSGRPYSYTFDGSGVFNDSSSGSDNALLYVISGINDPFISPQSDTTAVAALNDYIANEPCLNADRGRTATRNGCRNDWFLDLDLRFQQELPVPGSLDDKFTFFVDFDNFANLISSGSNIFRQRNSNVALVDVGVDEEGRYIISGFDPEDNQNIVTSASVWAIQFGVRYEF